MGVLKLSSLSAIVITVWNGPVTRFQILTSLLVFSAKSLGKAMKPTANLYQFMGDYKGRRGALNLVLQLI